MKERKYGLYFLLSVLFLLTSSTKALAEIKVETVTITTIIDTATNTSQTSTKKTVKIIPKSETKKYKITKHDPIKYEPELASINSPSATTTTTAIPLNTAITNNNEASPSVLTPTTVTDLTPIDNRINQIITKQRPTYLINPYQPNYIIYSHISNWNAVAYSVDSHASDWAQLQNQELKYQISFYIPISFGTLFGQNSSLNFAYTQHSYFQIKNTAISSPFRETDYEPQLFSSLAVDYDIAGFKLKLISFGYQHQSNGQSDPLSRGWDRLFVETTFRRDHWTIQARAWQRIDKYFSPVKETQDSNPRINKYMGDGYINIGYNFGHSELTAKTHFSLYDSHPGIEVGYSFRVSKDVQLYAQVFYGYGENMIDYDIKQTRYGLGIILNNYF